MVPLVRPTIQRRDLEGVLESMVRDQVGPGSLSCKLSSALEKFLFGDCGRVFRDRMTAASVVWDIFGLQTGDTVVFSSLGSLTLAQCAQKRGLRVVLADVSEAAPVVDPASVASVCASQPSPPKLLVADHPLGYLPDIKGLASLGIPVLEDLRWGFGGYRDLELAGARAQAALVGLEEDSLVCAGGGEFLAVRGKALAAAYKTQLNQFSDEIFLSDLNAALGLSQFQRRDELSLRRREQHRRCFTALRRGAGASFQQEGEAEPVLSYFPLVVDSGVQEVLAYSRKKGVAAELAFGRTAAALFPDCWEGLPRTRSLVGRCLVFPLHTAMTAAEQKNVLSVLGTLP